MSEIYNPKPKLVRVPGGWSLEYRIGARVITTPPYPTLKDLENVLAERERIMREDARAKRTAKRDARRAWVAEL
jgi:hypothetical protein